MLVTELKAKKYTIQLFSLLNLLYLKVLVVEQPYQSETLKSLKYSLSSHSCMHKLPLIDYLN